MHIDIEECKRIQKAIKPYIRKTRLLECPLLSSHLKTKYRVFLKLENEQVTKSFKPRPAFSTLIHLSAAGKRHGVVSRSSGNFAQALALAAKELNIRATIVMSKSAPEIKKNLTKQYDPVIVYSGPTHAEANAVVQQLATKHHLHILSPYDHVDVIKGNTSIALEIHEECPSIRHFFAPIGGGGLLSGCSMAFKLLNPAIQIHGVEPSGANDYFLSREEGKSIVLPTTSTIADGLRANSVGHLNRPILDQNVDHVNVVSDEQILKAMKFLEVHYDLAIEPSGATALASLLFSPQTIRGDTVCIITGGNVDPDQYTAWMQNTQIHDI